MSLDSFNVGDGKKGKKINSTEQPPRVNFG